MAQKRSHPELSQGNGAGTKRSRALSNYSTDQDSFSEVSPVSRRISQAGADPINNTIDPALLSPDSNSNLANPGRPLHFEHIDLTSSEDSGVGESVSPVDSTRRASSSTVAEQGIVNMTLASQALAIINSANSVAPGLDGTAGPSKPKWVSIQPFRRHILDSKKLRSMLENPSETIGLGEVLEKLMPEYGVHGLYLPEELIRHTWLSEWPRSRRFWIFGNITKTILVPMRLKTDTDQEWILLSWEVDTGSTRVMHKPNSEHMLLIRAIAFRVGTQLDQSRGIKGIRQRKLEFGDLHEPHDGVDVAVTCLQHAYGLARVRPQAGNSTLYLAILAAAAHEYWPPKKLENDVFDHFVQEIKQEAQLREDQNDDNHENEETTEPSYDEAKNLCDGLRKVQARLTQCLDQVLPDMRLLASQIKCSVTYWRSEKQHEADAAATAISKYTNTLHNLLRPEVQGEKEVEVHASIKKYVRNEQTQRTRVLNQKLREIDGVERKAKRMEEAIDKFKGKLEQLRAKVEGELERHAKNWPFLVSF